MLAVLWAGFLVKTGESIFQYDMIKEMRQTVKVGGYR